MIQVYDFAQINILDESAVNGSPVAEQGKSHSGTSASLRQVYDFAQINILDESAVNGSPVAEPRKNHSPDRETKEAAIEGRRGPPLRFGKCMILPILTLPSHTGQAN
jgi:hypothetical protein